LANIRLSWLGFPGRLEPKLSSGEQLEAAHLARWRRLRRRPAVHPIPWFAAATVNGTYLRFNSHQAGLAAVPQADP
jgi:hypothetical protein